MKWDSRYWPAVPLALFTLFVIASALVAPPLDHSDQTAEIVHSASFNDIKQTSAKYYDVSLVSRQSLHTALNGTNGTNKNHLALVAFEQTGVDCPEHVTLDCALTGARIINTTTGAIEWRYEWLSYQQFSTEVHDADYLPDRNEVVIADMERERIFTVDVNTKQITWQWNASQVYQPPDDPRATDWLHINDVDRIEPGLFMVSVRNADHVLFIDRECTCVAEVINPSSDNRLLNKQHNPQWLGENAVLVSDSENDRVVQLERRGRNDWQITWALYEVDEQPLDWPRDADRLPNGNLLITDTYNRRIVEVTPEGELVRSIRIPGDAHVYEADVNGREYPSGGPIDVDRDVGPIRGQPFGQVSYAYNGLNYWIGLPYWINEWHVLFAPLAVLASVGLFVWRWWV